MPPANRWLQNSGRWNQAIHASRLLTNALALPPMSNSLLTAPDKKPHVLIRGLVSLVIVVYFTAVLAIVTGISSGRFAAPEICAEAASWARPGLQPLNLDSAHRYYVPNPGAEPVLWVRITHESGL